MQTSDFLRAVKSIVSESPTYRTGGSGTDGTCDCVGLIMGAMRRVDRSAKFPLHSSNYFARKRMSLLVETGAVEPSPCMAVYKARPDNGDLHARYKEGGQFFNGSLLDYYHMGVVIGTNPLHIAHCTSASGVNGIAIDNTIKGWTHIGQLSDIDYDEGGEPSVDAMLAKVQTSNGKELKLRPTPSTDKPYIAEMPNGAVVQVHADAEGWAKVSWDGKTGYCMSKFLAYDNGFSAETNGDKVTISIDRSVAESVYVYLAEVLGH